MPLADAGSGVTLALQQIGNRGFLGVQAMGVGGKNDMAVHPDALGIAASEQRGAGWTADRARDMEIGELPTLSRELVEVGGLDRLRSKTTKIVVTLVIGEDDDEIRFVRSRQERGTKKGEEKDRAKHDF